MGAHEGIIVFTAKNDTTNHALASGEDLKNTVEVDIITMDKVLSDESPTLIKIDVEGYETAELEGAQRTLNNKSLNAVILELNGSGNRYGYDESKIFNLMRNYGFKTYSYNPLKRKLLNIDGKNINSGNTLFIRNISFVEDRLITAKINIIHGQQL